MEDKNVYLITPHDKNLPPVLIWSNSERSAHQNANRKYKLAQEILPGEPIPIMPDDKDLPYGQPNSDIEALVEGKDYTIINSLPGSKNQAPRIEDIVYARNGNKYLLFLDHPCKV